MVLLGGSWQLVSGKQSWLVVVPANIGLWDPFQMAMNMAEINGGDPNYLLNEMIRGRRGCTKM